MRQKITICVKVLILKLALPDDLVGNFSLHVHEPLQHVVVRMSTKQNFASIELINSATSGPHINTVIIRHAENNLGRSIEARDQIRRDVIVLDQTGAAKVAQLQHQVALIHQNVVGFDVCVQYLALFEELQRQKELLRVTSHCLDVQAHIFAVLFEHLTEVHRQRLHDHA